MRYLPLPTRRAATSAHGLPYADAVGRHDQPRLLHRRRTGDIYLPVDTAADAPTVAAQADDPDSLLNSVKSLLAFRHAHADLNADAPFRGAVRTQGERATRPFVWQRGDLICAVNPAGVSIELPLELAEDLRIQYTIGKAEIVNDTLSLGAQSFAILG